MPKRRIGIFYIALAALLAAVVILTVLLFTILYRYDQRNQHKSELYPVVIEGEYSEEGGEWKPLTEKTHFETVNLRDISVRGHFSRELPRGEKLFLNIDQLRVSLRVNGEEIYRLAPSEMEGNLTKAQGRQWVSVLSPGISKSDFVELTFGNLYWNSYFIQFDELLWNMHTGDERMMLFEAIREDNWTMGIGAVFLFFALFLFVTTLCCFSLRISGALQFFWLGMSALSASFWFFTLSSAPTLLLPLPVLLNVLYAYSMQGMLMFLLLFILAGLSGWRRQVLKGCEAVLLLALFVGLLNQLLRIQDLYPAINWFSVLDLLVALCILCCLAYEAFCRKKEESASLLKALALLAVCGILELINGFVQFSEAAVMLGIGFLSFTLFEEIHLLRRIKQSMENERRAFALENELNQSRISTMVSQIQPHFLYNALSGIKQLCDTDPARASEALEHFSFYLRGNLDALADTRLIPFEKELVHIRDYLYLEKMRFSEKLSIEWEIAYQDFLLPPLAVQPLIENAIRHGIRKKKDGGTLTIRSERIGEDAVITICDDGVGFDVSEQKEDGRSHVGIANTRCRLESLCGGSLVLESKKGAGTSVKVILPLSGA